MGLSTREVRPEGCSVTPSFGPCCAGGIGSGGVGFGIFEVQGGHTVKRVAYCDSRADADRVKAALEAADRREKVDDLFPLPLAHPPFGPDSRVVCYVAGEDDGQAIGLALQLADDLKAAAAKAVQASPEVNEIVRRAAGR